jgi:hypothetical protein
VSRPASEVRVKSRPAPELRIMRSALAAVGVLAVPVLGVAWYVAGTSGLLGAGIGVALVAVLFLVTGVAMSVAAPHGPAALMAAALGGFAAQFVLYALLLVLLRPVEAIHGPSLAIGTAVVMVATLAFEAWHVNRVPSFFWVDPAAGRTAAAQEGNDG